MKILNIKKKKDTWRGNFRIAAIQDPKCTRRTVRFRAIYLQFNVAYRNLFLKTSVAVRLPPEEVPPLTMLHFATESNVAGEQNHLNAHKK